MNRTERKTFLEKKVGVDQWGAATMGTPSKDIVTAIVALEIMGIHEVLKGIEECQKAMVRGQHRVYPRQKVKD